METALTFEFCLLSSDFLIDLRSDTVTRPTDAMRAAIAAAPVGDDQFGEDPSVNLLQERVAAILGKESALWVPTGTMANQIALKVLTAPGDDVIVSRESHAVWHEAGASAVNAGVQFTEIGSGGAFTCEEFLSARKPRDHMMYPPTTLLEIENTHNRAGGIIVDQREVIRICDAARAHDVATFLDGARLWNAAVATGSTPAELAAPFDFVSVALSKGLGAPAGSVVAGSRAHIRRAVRARRVLGGAMRQAGILAAAGLHAIDHHLDDLADDHAKARQIADRLVGRPGIRIDRGSVQTNIVIFHLDTGGPDAASVVTRARARGVLVVAFGPRTVRAVTHRDVTPEQCLEGADVLAAVASEP